MIRIILGVIAGFFAWIIVWFGFETILSVLWRAFGVHQAAFQAAIENGSPFTPDTTILFVHIILALVASLVAGYLAVTISGENRRAPLVLGLLLIGLGLLKAGMSWPLVPVWYHVLFTAVLLPVTIIGGRLRSSVGRN